MLETAGTRLVAPAPRDWHGKQVKHSSANNESAATEAFVTRAYADTVTVLRWCRLLACRTVPCASLWYKPRRLDKLEDARAGSSAHRQFLETNQLDRQL